MAGKSRLSRVRGPGSLNNSGKLFMAHALFIHRLRVRSPARTEEEHVERMMYTTTQREREKKTQRGDIEDEDTTLPTVQ